VEEIKKYKINLKSPKSKVIFALELDTAELYLLEYLVFGVDQPTHRLNVNTSFH